MARSVRHGRQGLLGGLADPQLSRALAHIHSDVGRAWTIAELAKSAGMSRSRFARRFVDVVGAAPVEYLLAWRMALAKDALLHSQKPLSLIAADAGDRVGMAFSTAFSVIGWLRADPICRSKPGLDSPFMPGETPGGMHSKLRTRSARSMG